MGTIFEHAINVANAEIKVPLRVIKEEVAYGDSFQAYGTLCKLLQVSPNTPYFIQLSFKSIHLFP